MTFANRGNSSYQSSIVRLLLVSTLSFEVSCALSEDVELAHRSEPKVGEAPTSVEQNGDPTLPFESSIGEPSVRFEMPNRVRLSADDALAFELVNEADEPAQVRFEAFVRSERGSSMLEDVASLVLGAGRSAQVHIPAHQLQLPVGQLQLPGIVNFNAVIQYPSRARQLVSPALYVEPDEHGWQLYDEAEHRHRVAVGPIAETVRAALAKLPAGAELTLSYPMTERERLALLAKDNRQPIPEGDALSDTPQAPQSPERAKDVPVETRATRAAFNTRICFIIESVFNDAATGDFMTQTGVAGRPATGMFYQIVDPNSAVLSSGYLGDGRGSAPDGCTNTITIQTGMNYTMAVESQASAGGTTIQVLDDTASGFTQTLAVTRNFSGTLGASTPIAIATGTYNTPINTTIGMAYALSHSPGSVSINSQLGGDTLAVHLRNAEGGGFTCSASDPRGTWFFDKRIPMGGSSLTQLKFALAHEVGHGVLAASTRLTGSFCSGLAYDASDEGGFAGDALCRAAGSNVHGLWTREYSSAAANEGFADFYAAQLFNDKNQADCSFSQLGLVVDCQGTLNYPEAFMTKRCESPSGFTPAWPRTRGVEYDWLRMFWDMLTFGTSHPNFDQILQWIGDSDNAQAFTRTNWYQRLDAQANFTTRLTIRDAWNARKYVNGVNGAPVISLRATQSNGNLVAHEVNWTTGETAGLLRARTAFNSVGDWEKYELFNDDPNQVSVVSLRALGYRPFGTEKLVTAEVNSADPIVRASNATSVGDWERFTMEYDLVNNLAAFKAANGKYVTAEKNADFRLHARADTVREWERYTTTILP